MNNDETQTKHDYTIKDYVNALAGIGPLAHEWEDKPHRLVYDLCKRWRDLEAENVRLRKLAAEALDFHTSLSKYAKAGDAPNQIKIPMLPFRWALKDRLTRMVHGE